MTGKHDHMMHIPVLYHKCTISRDEKYNCRNFMNFQQELTDFPRTYLFKSTNSRWPHQFMLELFVAVLEKFKIVYKFHFWNIPSTKSFSMRIFPMPSAENQLSLPIYTVNINYSLSHDQKQHSKPGH